MNIVSEILLPLFFATSALSMQPIPTQPSPQPAAAQGSSWWRLLVNMTHTIGFDPSTQKSVDNIIVAANKFNDQPSSLLGLTEVLKKGVDVKFQIPRYTMIAGIGTFLAAASIVLLYKELTKAESTQTPEQKIGFLQRTKQFLTSSYTIDLTGLVAGLLLIIKSQSLAEMYA